MGRLLLALIRLLTPAAEREWVVGDTLEEFRHRQQISGRMPAWRAASRADGRDPASAPRHVARVRSGGSPI